MKNTSNSINPPSEELCNFIIDKLAISHGALELGIKKSFLENSPLPIVCLLYTSPSPRDQRGSRMPSSA